MYETDDMARVHMFQGDASIVKALEECYRDVQVEIGQLREAKELNIVEDHVRDMVREQLNEMDEGPVGQDFKRKAKLFTE